MMRTTLANTAKALLISCAAALPAAAQLANVKTVFIVLMENHNWSQIKGSASAPYINNTLLPMASHGEQYFNPPGIHPSLRDTDVNGQVVPLMSCGRRRVLEDVPGRHQRNHLPVDVGVSLCAETQSVRLFRRRYRRQRS